MAGSIKPPFNKGSLTRLVAIVQSRSMFPWRQQLISCVHRLAELKGSENSEKLQLCGPERTGRVGGGSPQMNQINVFR